MPCICALSSVLLAGSVRTTRWSTARLRRAVIAGVSSASLIERHDRRPEGSSRSQTRGTPRADSARRLFVLLVAGSGVVPAVAVRESRHQLAEEAMELLPLRPREHRGDPPLSLGLRPDSPVPRRVALLRGFDQLAAAVARVGQATNQAGRLQPVETVGHRAAGQAHVAGELTGRAAVRRSIAAQAAEQVERPPVEIEGGE